MRLPIKYTQLIMGKPAPLPSQSPQSPPPPPQSLATGRAATALIWRLVTCADFANNSAARQLSFISGCCCCQLLPSCSCCICCCCILCRGVTKTKANKRNELRPSCKSFAENAASASSTNLQRQIMQHSNKAPRQGQKQQQEKQLKS